MVKLLFIVFIALINITLTNLQYQPVIGIVAASIPEDSDDPNEAVVYLTYSKWAINSGSKVIPILPWYSHDKIDKILLKVNGIIWQGGMRNLRVGGHFENLNNYIFNKVKEINDEKNHLPMFLICQGFELLHILIVNDTSILSKFKAMKYYIPMETNENTYNSKMYKKFTEKDFDTFTKKNSTVHFHDYGFEPYLYKKHKILDNFFSINSYGLDRDGKKYIGSVEAKNYPIYAVQYHPEKVRYERKINPNNIVNSEEAFEMSKKLADFFIEEAKKNVHRASIDDLREMLIIDTVNVEPIFYHQSWVYLFKKESKLLKR